MLRAEFVRRKLQLITDDLGRLSHYRDVDHDALLADFAVLATVERLLERIVMLAGLGVYPADFAEAIAPSAGLRNILVHDYNDADRRIVHAAIGACLAQYPRYVEHVLAFLDAVEQDDENPG